MADTYTTNLNLTKPEPGAAEDTWGISLNDDLDTLDAIFSSSGTQINLNPNQVNFADNKKAIFGTGGDLEIYHDGSHSYIKDAGTGQIKVLAGTNFQVLDTTGTNFAANFNASGESQLYYNGNLKLKTTASGIDVTGTVTSDGLTVDGLAEISAQTNGAYALRVGDAAGSSGSVAGIGKIGINPQGAGTFTYTGTEIRATENALGDYRARLSFHTRGSTSDVEPLERLRIDQTGDISFYDDTGTSQRLFWDASTERLGIGTTSPSAPLEVSGNIIATGNLISYVSTSSPIIYGGSTALQLKSNTGELFAEFFNNGAAELYYDNSKKLATTSSGVNVTGTVVSDGLTVQTAQGDIAIANSASSLNFARAGTNYIRATDSAGHFKFITGANDFATQRLNIAANGDISFYDDTGTTQGLFWDASAESLGIGTDSPSEALSVSGNAELGSANNLYLNNGGYDGVGTHAAIRWFSTGSAKRKAADIITAQADSFARSDLLFRTQSGTANADPTEVMRITHDNRVGIGTTSPSSALHIQGTGHTALTITGGAANDAQIKFGDSVDTDIGMINYDNASNSMKFIVNTSEAARINSSGNFGIGTTSPNGKLDIKTGNVGFEFYPENTNDTNLILNYDRSTNAYQNLQTRAASHQFLINASEKMRIDSSGNVGIGITAPAEKLSIQDGDIIVQNDTKVTFGYRGTSASSALAFRDRFAGVDRVTISAAGNVGIGTSSPSSVLEIADSGVELKITDTRNQSFTVGDIITTLGFYSDDASGSSGAANNLPRGAIDMVAASTFGSAHDMVFRTRADTSATASEKLRITSSGNVGIAGATTIDDGNLQIGDSDADFNIAVAGARSKFGYDSSNNSAVVQGGVTKGIIFCVNNNTLGSGEAGRFDSSGNLLVGKTAADISTDGIELGTRVESTADGTYPLRLNRRSSDGEIINFRKDGTSVGSIRVKSSILSIQTTTAGASYGGLRFGDGTIQPVDNNGNLNNGVMDLGSSAFRFKRGYFSDQIIINGTSPNIRLIDTDTNADSQISASSGFGALVLKADYNAETAGSFIGFEVDGSEAGRFDESGNLLVGTTDDSIAGSSTETGINANAIGALVASRTSGASGFFNRLSTDGIIVDLRRDGTTVGQLRGRSGDLIIQTGITGLRFNDANNAIHPVIANGTVSDNATDLGLSNSRFKDIYATNGTIQTSDINEKQDIEDLSEAETRVAVAAKGLLKKYRWKSAVADKGDDARIHFGIMAQDLQNAFANEGLDAGDYGMFISSTWTDEATGEEKTRLGVRYNELLAFIIAAI